MFFSVGRLTVSKRSFVDHRREKANVPKIYELTRVVIGGSLTDNN